MPTMHMNHDDCRALLLEARGELAAVRAQLAAQDRVISTLNHENDALRAKLNETRQDLSIMERAWTMTAATKPLTDRGGDFYDVVDVAGMTWD